MQMEQFFQFNYNSSNLQNVYAAQNLRKLNVSGNAPFAKYSKSPENNDTGEDTFKNRNKKNNKKVVFFSAIAIAAVLLGVGIKTGKIRKIFNNFINNFHKTAEKNSPKITENSPSEAIEKNSPKTIDNKPKKPFETPLIEEIPAEKMQPKKPAIKNSRRIMKVKSKLPENNIKTVAEKNSHRATREKIRQNMPQNSHIRYFNSKKDGDKNLKFTVIAKSPRITEALSYKAIKGILNKENLEVQDLRKIEKIFKDSTGINLYCPDSYHIKDFSEFFDLIFNGKFNERMDSKIKHIVIGHGIGCIQQNNWCFIGTRENVFNFIEKNIPKSDIALIMTCEETANHIRPGLGTTVNITLQQNDKPGKIVKSGERRVIGTITQDNPKIQYF